MTYPILYESTETKFQTMGLGFLSDCKYCKVTEERNGSYELEMEYPVSGIHFDDIKYRAILFAKPNYNDDKEPFRIYHIKKSSKGTIVVYAHHISYDLNGYPVAPFSATNIQGALSGLIANSMIDCPFSLSTTRSTNANFNVKVPSSIRSWLGGQTGSLLDVYGGEWHFKRYTATLENNRGSDNGVVIRYGKNLVDLTQEENCSNMYTGIICYWINTDGTLVKGNIVNAEGTFDFTKILSVDCSQDFQTAPSVADLDAKASVYIKSHNIGVPEISLTVSYVQHDTADNTDFLTDNEGVYLTTNSGDILISVQKGANTAVNLCDTVTIWFDKYNIKATAECIKTVWNVIQERYDSVDFGDAKSNLASTIAKISEKTNDVVTSSAMDEAVDYATKKITSAKGGHASPHDSDGDGYPDEYVVFDKATLQESSVVGRWNTGGLGFSTTGYDGKYDTAITSDGHINASMMTFGVLIGSLIKAGVIKDSSGINYWDLDKGIFHMGLNEYFTIQEDGSVLIGNSDSSMKLILTSDKISFVDNNVEVAYISNKELHIASSEVFESLSIDNGLDSDGYWQFHMRENGHLSLNYVDKK